MRIAQTRNEAYSQLLRNYTQNIDTLETLAGVQRVLQCHGSFATASCLRCKTRVPGPTIEPFIMRQEVPVCAICKAAREEEVRLRKAARRKGKGKAPTATWSDDDEDEPDGEWGFGEPGILKVRRLLYPTDEQPDITFFGQALDSSFDNCLFEDREKVDLLIIIGTSLKVAPVSEVLSE